MVPTDTVDYLLHHIVSLLTKQSDQVLQEQLGLTLSQFKILRILQSNSLTPQNEIASSLGQTEASISRQIKLMVERGHLHSLRHTMDRREHLTALTPRGEQLTVAATDALDKYYSPVFSALTEKQSKQLLEALGRLHGALCIHEHPGYAVTSL